MSNSYLAEAIISSLFVKSLQKESYSWVESETAIDFLLKFSRLKSLFPDYKPTVGRIRRKEEAKLAMESQQYLKELGLLSGKIFSVNKKGQVLINNKIPQERFSSTEEKVLKLLVNHKNSFCSFDKIGEVVWQENSYDSFSVWAITKLIQRLRNKLKNNGVSLAVIQTQRKGGYFLTD